MKFILQRQERFHKLFDFQIELFRAKDYYTWLDEPRPEHLKTEFEIIWEDELGDANPKEYCPIGSVEFCVSWYDKIWRKKPLPLNIPECFIKNSVSTRRHVFNSGSFDSQWRKQFRTPTVFIKSMLTIKDPINGEYDKNNPDIWTKVTSGLYGDFQVSEKINEIASEWRCFIYKGELLDIKCYSGSPFIMPTLRQIKNKMDVYTDSPIAYTLDLAMTRPNVYDGVGKYSQVEVIEVHDFFSCGLYGFSDYKNLPLMFWRWFKDFTK